MSNLESITRKADDSPRKINRELPMKSSPRIDINKDPRQRGLMGGALFLLLLALTIVLWHDRSFWFPDTQEANSAEPVESLPAAKGAAVQPSPPVAQPGKSGKAKHQNANQQAPTQKGVTQQAVSPQSLAQPAAPQSDSGSSEPAPPGAIISARTALPPLEVEVVAGDSHRTMRPGSNSVHVELEPDLPRQPASSAPAESESAANVTSEAAERVQMSASTSDNVAAPVRPNYPMLARQMKVQGSVILQALIGKDGVIQNLRVVRGPHILAAAAEDAVRQWHFKPHYEGGDAVETQAKITVNFTISTN
jgi:TonB family protein